MVDTSFITDETLRFMIDRDIVELKGCIDNKLYKSALIMAGSIIEAVLVDFFLAFPPKNGIDSDQIMRADLATLIDWAADNDVNLISETTKNIATVIRNYRNLIHPGVEHRKQFSIDENKANVAYNLVEIIFNEVRENYLKKLGYTAEQAVKKLKMDINSVSIFDHIIQNMSPIEKVKLFKSLPYEAYKECNEYTDDYLADNHADDLLKSFCKVHEMLKPHISNEYRKKETLEIYNFIVRNGTQTEILFFIRFFVKDLNLLDESERETVINYILNLIETGDESNIYQVNRSGIDGFGVFLNNKNGVTRISKLINNQIWRKNVRTEELDDSDVVFLDTILILLVDIDFDLVNTIIIEQLESKKFELCLAYSEYMYFKLIPI